MFSDNELCLSAICKLIFKLSWLDTEDYVRRGKNCEREIFQSFQGFVDESDT